MTERISPRMKAVLMGGFLFALLLAVAVAVAGQTGGSCWGVAHHEGQFCRSHDIWGGVISPPDLFNCGCTDGLHALVTVRYVGTELPTDREPDPTYYITVYWRADPLTAADFEPGKSPRDSELVQEVQLPLGGGVTVWATWVRVEIIGNPSRYTPFGEYAITYFLPTPRSASLIGNDVAVP